MIACSSVCQYALATWVRAAAAAGGDRGGGSTQRMLVRKPILWISLSWEHIFLLRACGECVCVCVYVGARVEEGRRWN